jgi:aryl-alcohol dehydrogenase-like predicted oxidoreductase
METRSLGATGVRVSALALGTMMFGQWGEPDHDACAAILHRALDAGITLIDTADMYSRGESETIVGQALLGRRDDVVLATKFHNPMHKNDPLQRGNSRRWIMREVESSLRRLQTDWIDLYQVHRPEPGVDFDETLGALSDLVTQGKIRYIGTSTFPAEDIVEGQWIAERRAHKRVVAEQPPYSIFVRGIERDVLPTAGKYGMGVLSWSPLAGGWLSGRYRADNPVAPDQGSRATTLTRADFDLQSPANAAKLSAAHQLAELADGAGISVVELALAFVLEHPAITSAIIGPRTAAQLEGQLSAPEVRLSGEVLDRIDEIVAPGTNLAGTDVSWTPPGLDAAARRRGR